MSDRNNPSVLRGLPTAAGAPDEDDVRLIAAVDAALDALGERDPEEAGASPELVPLLRARKRLRDAERAFRDGHEGGEPMTAQPPGVIHPLARTLRELAADVHRERHGSDVGFFVCEDGVCKHSVAMLNKYAHAPWPPDSDDPEVR